MRVLKSAVLVAMLTALALGEAPTILHAGPGVARDSGSDVARDSGSDVARDFSPAITEVRDVTIPAGTPLTVQLGSTVSSRSSHVEQPVHATLRRAVIVDGVTVLPAGTAISGYVTEAARSGRVKGRARIGVRFTSLRVGDTRYGIRTQAITRQAPGTKKSDATRIGIGAGTGAVVGAIAGGKKGAAVGSAVGAAGGTGVVLATRGQEAALGRGATVTTRLAQPVTIRLR